MKQVDRGIFKVARTETLRNVVDARWSPLRVPLIKLCGEHRNHSLPLELHVGEEGVDDVIAHTGPMDLRTMLKYRFLVRSLH